MPVEYAYLSGKAMWCRTREPNQWGNWSTTLYLNPESVSKFRELQDQGVLTHLKKDDDNQYYVQLKRPTKLKRRNGQEVPMAPIQVLDKENRIIPDLIGNQSDVTIKLEMYPYTIPLSSGKKGKAIRIASIRVDNLVPYEPSSLQEGSNEERLVRGLPDQPPQVQERF